MPFLKKYNHPKWKQKEESTYKSGYRHIFFLNGSVHIGEWRKNVKEGKGAFVSRKKFLYEGDFLNGKRHGHGVLSFGEPDGSQKLIYRGQWKNGEKEGYGIQRSESGGYYEGEWICGQRCGKGKAWFTDGCFYQGTWRFNRVHGTGVLVFANGNWYDGEFNNGYQHGRGKYYHRDAERIQEGEWQCGLCVSSVMREAADVLNEYLCIPSSPPQDLAEDAQEVFYESHNRERESCESDSLQLSCAENPSFL